MNVKKAAAPVKEQWAGARAALSLTSLSVFSSENSSQADCMWEKSWRHFRRQSGNVWENSSAANMPAMFHFQLKRFLKVYFRESLQSFKLFLIKFDQSCNFYVLVSKMIGLGRNSESSSLKEKQNNLQNIRKR